MTNTEEGINISAANDFSGNTMDKEELLKANKGDVDPETLPRDGLVGKHVAAYAVGHFNNDLCAAMWFVYLSWYVKDVV